MLISIQFPSSLQATEMVLSVPLRLLSLSQAHQTRLFICDDFLAFPLYWKALLELGRHNTLMVERCFEEGISLGC